MDVAGPRHIGQHHGAPRRPFGGPSRADRDGAGAIVNYLAAVNERPTVPKPATATFSGRASAVMREPTSWRPCGVRRESADNA